MSLSPGQQEVLKALATFNQSIDDAGLAVYVHHVANSDMSSSGVRTRRAELSRKGFIRTRGTKRTKSGRSAAIHSLTAKGTRKAAAIA